ncbi:LexA family transcriptional repressor [Bacterioplanes sanyensis]|uniref:LexA family transcriptional repressor n=1 Tax=Bacterioplanes sanyensis TaxID=1249553 RepID=A0A222FJU3_9GAMM|nr:LexA family transcriptional regulator [Bacterioplanes sanyensis]ASP38503.1 LexA family transcriptional repressor [Bacterioplanes sanyensis]
MSLSQRFNHIVDTVCDGNKAQFARLTGKSPSHVYKICRGQARPSMRYLETIYEQLNVDITWLLTGDQADRIQKLAPKDSTNDLVYAPVLDVQASAGFGASGFSEELEQQFVLDRQWLSQTLRISGDRLFCIHVSGDSMLPTLEDGDMILVDPAQQQLQSNSIYVLSHADGLMTKRLQRQGETIQVISDNDSFSDWTLDPNDEQTQVVGKVVWCSRRMR